ncbi:MAG: undecaprenyldiphospho-muramoylpentapeptide beta-N-acetylglucosaminyltransferase [Alicyclobacillus sp.]|nr:undecaprenyldiphospho-muramoylpentapeptide beta-N-acetylglucosaminyltransferase [Alicyclobacillus sp.]
MRKIMFTGGGSAGHVTVNLALIPRLLEDGWSVVYVGSQSGIEKELVTARGIRYIGISSGKLRRYFDVKNLSDPLRVLKGILQAVRIVRREKPDVLFSKGGFVSVPVVIGAWLNHVPVILHESDLTPGLANRISMRFAHTICTTFRESEKYLPKDKVLHVGAVIREELRSGDPRRGMALCNFPSSARNKPILVVMGGSLGARRINETVRLSLGVLSEHFNIVHLCGKGNLDPHITSDYYRQYEYLSDELPDVLAAADVVVSRAGANAIFELLHLRKPMLLIPLPKSQSRGDQILNAQAFEASGFCKVLDEERMTPESLVAAIHEVYQNRQTYIHNMAQAPQQDTLTKVIEHIERVARR